MAFQPSPASASLAVRDYRASTFRERGVAVPFTTPLLAGARVREAEQGGTELVMLNPSGAPGVYILACNALGALCRPSVHDTRLNQKISTLPHITPASVRDAAREVAASGLAGREAMAAALALAEADKRDRQQIETTMLAALARQLGPQFSGPLEVGQMAVQLASRLGIQPRSVAAALSTLAEGLLSVGLTGQPPPGRAARMMERLASLSLDLNLWLCDMVADTNSDLADLILAAAEHARSAAGAALATARGLVGDPVGLLHAIARTPEPIRQCMTRPEWLLDGWEPVYGLWQCAEGPADRHGALVQMARLVPSLPREAAEWAASPGDGSANRRPIGLDATSRSETIGRAMAARNERLRALAT
ncbi:MAG TPA: hypothetical protein VNW90_24270 [Acetobacteraceae bacterium]|jgi:hypothetical protein|nr:hypothetical protein [Acetobacteraceae bacterium]